MNDFSLKEELREVNLRIFREQVEGRAAVEAKRLYGFDKNKDRVRLKNKGRINLRKLDTIPKGIQIDRIVMPWEVSFASGINVKAMYEAARFALDLLKKRAPRLSGAYRDDARIRISDTNSQVIEGGRIALKDFDENTRIFVSSTVPYSAIIEHGFYKRLYKTPPIIGGIVRPIARKVRAAYGKDGVACRFTYMVGRDGKGTVAAVEIGVKGFMPENDSVVGRTRPRGWRG